MWYQESDLMVAYRAGALVSVEEALSVQAGHGGCVCVPWCTHPNIHRSFSTLPGPPVGQWGQCLLDSGIFPSHLRSSCGFLHAGVATFPALPIRFLPLAWNPPFPCRALVQMGGITC